MFDTETIDPFDIDKNDSNETAAQGLSLVNTNNDEPKAKGKGKSKSKSKNILPTNENVSTHLLLFYDTKSTLYGKIPYEGRFQVVDESEFIDSVATAIKDPITTKLVKIEILNPRIAFDG